MADQDQLVQELLTPYSLEVRELVELLRELVRSTAPELTEEVKMGWHNIVYKKKSVIVAVAPQKKYAQLYFYKGTSLSDPAGLLEGTGKGLRHIKVHQPDDMTGHKEAIITLIREALRLNES